MEKTSVVNVKFELNTSLKQQFWLIRKLTLMCVLLLNVPTVIQSLYQNTYSNTGAPKVASIYRPCCCLQSVYVLPMLPCKDSYLCHWNSFKKACIQTAPSSGEIINIFSLSAAHYGRYTLITGWIYGALRPHSPCFGRASVGTGFKSRERMTVKRRRRMTGEKDEEEGGGEE